MEGINNNTCERALEKSPVSNKDPDLLETEREIKTALEFIEMSPDLENEIQGIDSLKIQEQNYTVVEEFCDTSKKYLGQANDNNSKPENKVSIVDSPTCSKFRLDTSDLETEIDFSFTKKKKKKKSAIIHESKILPEDECNTVANLLDDIIVSDPPTNDVDSDYTYDFLLSRVFDIMREKNSDIDTDVRKKLIIKPPQVLRAGTKRTSFANFLELCKTMRRSPQHVQSFLIVELGTNGSVDSNGQLVIKGKFQQKQLEAVLRKYIKEYVTCHTCHSPDTMLLKETRLCFLQCEACGSRCSVPIIKSGFQAVINKRAAMRARCN